MPQNCTLWNNSTRFQNYSSNYLRSMTIDPSLKHKHSYADLIVSGQNQWSFFIIFTNWTADCEINLCSKGFFIVKFLSQEAREHIQNAGPWFWGSTRLFTTPSFPDFDANTMEVSKMPIWVRLYNLPLHLWNEDVLGSIRDMIGSYIKTDTQRMEERVFTFARICVEVDLRKGLPECILMTHKQQKWMQHIDYENTAFRYTICRNIGHL